MGPRSVECLTNVSQVVLVSWRLPDGQTANDSERPCNARKPRQIARRGFRVQEAVTFKTNSSHPRHHPVKDGELWSAFGLQGLPGLIAVQGDGHIVAPPDQGFIRRLRKAASSSAIRIFIVSPYGTVTHGNASLRPLVGKVK